LFNYTNLEVQKSEVSVITVAIAPWEVPVFEAVNGEDRCKVTGKTEVRRELPDANDEYTRLDLKYKANGDGQSYVGMVYGIGSIGVERLAKEIDNARVVETASPAGDVGDDDPTAELFRDAPVMAEGARAIEQ
jgi:hypothetical protein